MKHGLAALLIALMAAFPVCAQQVYTWTDANGIKHFSDAPPPPNTKDSKTVTVRGGVTSTQTNVPAPAEEVPTKEGPSMAAAAGYSAEDIKRNCETSRRNLDIMNARKPTAEASVEEQVEFQEEVGKIQQQITLFCG